MTNQFLNTNEPSTADKCNKLAAIVFDWAGTTVDFGSIAPVEALRSVFKRKGLSVANSDLRTHMGLPKRHHIAAILTIPSVETAWEELHGRAFREEDLDALYKEFIPTQMDAIELHAALIPGVVDVVNRLRLRGLKVGSNTGYTRPMLDILLKHSMSAGFQPDASTCPEESGGGRPHPYMLNRLASELNISPMAAIAKVGDTPADIQEGLNAGTWSIGVAASGNQVGLSLDEWTALSADSRNERLSAARGDLRDAGAHYVIDSIIEIEPVLDDIDRRLASR